MWLGLVPEVVHTEGELAGMITHRLYLYTPNDDDFLSACFGDDSMNLVISSTSTPSWFQHEIHPSALATDINPLLFDFFPNLVYDSWLTIGQENCYPHPDSTCINLIAWPPEELDAFNQGEDLVINSPAGAAWFAVNSTSNNQAISGSDRRVLVAQLTTSGEISGQLGIQLFLHGEGSDELRQLLPILWACNDPEALNYEPLSHSTDGCQYPVVDRVPDVVESLDIQMHPNPANSTVTLRLPDVWSSNWQGANVRALSWDGRVQATWILNSSNQTLDLSDLASGSYVLSVVQNGHAIHGLTGTLVVVH